MGKFERFRKPPSETQSRQFTCFSQSTTALQGEMNLKMSHIETLECFHSNFFLPVSVLLYCYQSTAVHLLTEKQVLESAVTVSGSCDTSCVVHKVIRHYDSFQALHHYKFIIFNSVNFLQGSSSGLQVLLALIRVWCIVGYKDHHQITLRLLIASHVIQQRGLD